MAEQEKLDFRDPATIPPEKDRGTDPTKTFRQGVAGVTDVATGLPSLAGLIPAAAGAGYEAATTDKGFLESFKEHNQLPFMQSMYGATKTGRDFVNSLLGIEEPKLIEDQAARLMTSSFIPGIGALGALQKAGGVLGAAGRIATPVMKVTKSPTGSYLTGGNILRGGAQIGMGGTIDQTMRHVLPHPEFPTMFSEEAITGSAGDTELGGGQGDDRLDFRRPPSDPNKLDFRPPTAIDAPVSSAQNKGFAHNLNEKLIAAHEENEREAMSDTALGVATVVGALFGSYHARRAIARKTQAASDKAGPLGSADPDIQGFDKALLEISEQSGGKNKLRKGASIAKNYLHKDWADATQHAVAMMKSKGVDEEVVQNLAHVAHSDWKSIAAQFDWTGELGQGSGIKTHAPRDLRFDYDSLNSTDPVMQIGPRNHLTQRELYDLSEVARTEQTNRTMATGLDVIERSDFANKEIPGLAEAMKASDLGKVSHILTANADEVDIIRRTPTDVDLETYPHMANPDGSYKLFKEAQEIRTGLREKAGAKNIVWGQGNRLSNDILSAVVKAADADPAIKALSKKTSETLDALLDYRVHLSELTDTQAKAYRKRFTVGPKDDQRLAYIPMITARSKPELMERLWNLSGRKTRQAQELNMAKELHQRSIDRGQATDKPILPLDALNWYAQSAIEGVNVNNFQHHTLKFITQMRHAAGKGNDELHDLQYVGKDSQGNIKRIEELPNPKTEAQKRSRETSEPQYLGYRPFNSTNDSLGDWKGFTPGYGQATMRAVSDVDPDVVWTMQHGRLHAWKVPDAGLRASLDLNPNLGNWEHFFRHWNTVFKAGTTGPLSAFAPVAHVFSSQQIASNVVGRSVAKSTGKAVGEGAISRVEGLKGTWELMKDGWAKERAEHLSQRIADKMSRGEMPTQAQLALKNRLETAYRNSFSLRVQKESGRTSGYIGADTRGSRNAFLDSFNENEANFVGHVGIDNATHLWRMWKAWNHAWHEGPAYAQMLKHYRKNLREGMSELDEARLLREGSDVSKELAGDMRRVGSSTAAKWFDNAVPFAPAMIQSWASIGGAIMANPRRFLAGVSALVMAPTAAEVMWNFTMSSDDDVYYDDNGRGWTHNEYYWKGFNAQQRASTNIVMIPGKPPWEAHQWPVSPEWGFVRGFVIDSLDAILNVSGTRSFNDLKPEQWNIVAGFNRVTDIAMPPPFAAAFTRITGQSVRGGLSFDPDKGEVSLTTAMPIVGGGGRYSAQNMSQAQGSMDRMSAELLQDIFGSAGKLLTDIWNHSSAGYNDRAVGSIGNAVQRGTEAAGLAIHQQLKFPALVFGRTSKLSTMQPAGKRMFRIKDNIKALQNMGQTLQTGGVGDLRRIFSGSGLTNMMNDNAVWSEVALSIGNLTQTLQPGNEEITSLRRDNNSLGMDGKLSVTQVKRQLDANNAALNDIYNEQYALTKEWEKDMAGWLQDRFRDPSIEIDLEGDIPQSRLESKSYLERLMTP